MSNSLFRKKSIAQIQADAAAGFSEADIVPGQPAEPTVVALRRSLGTFDLTMMGIAAIIGAGIFAMVGQASYHGGPGVILLFIFAAIACGFSALCYAEFASKIPIAGSAYTYAYASFGELLAWIIGWDLLVEYAIGNIAVAISWSGYFNGLLVANGINIPLHFTTDYRSAHLGYDAVQQAISDGSTLDALRSGCSAVDAALTCDKLDAYQAWLTAPQLAGWRVILDVPAVVIVILITALVYVGIRESKIASNIMVGLKLAVIMLVIILGAFFVKTANWHPFLPNGFGGVMSGVAAVFFAYIGFDALSTTAEECKEPYKTLPRGMIYSLIICTILYVALALVITGMVSYKTLNVSDPLAFVFGPEGVNIPWVSGVIAVSAIIAIATVLLVFQLGQPRLWMAMSRDGLLPKIFSSIHPKFRTPWFSTILTGVMVAVPALFMNLSEVTDLSVIGTLFAFTIVCAGVLVKDKEFAGQQRFVPYISSMLIGPILFLLVCFLLVYGKGVSELNVPIFDSWNQFFASLTNSEIYSTGFSSIRSFFTLTPSQKDINDAVSAWAIFFERLPYFVFGIFSLGMAVLCFIKRLSLIPILGVMCCTYLMTELGWTNWFRFGLWMMVGLRIYRLYSFKNSRLNPEGTEASTLSILSVVTMLIDVILLAVFILPYLEIWLEWYDNWMVNLPISIVIAVLLELITRRYEKKTV